MKYSISSFFKVFIGVLLIYSISTWFGDNVKYAEKKEKPQEKFQKPLKRDRVDLAIAQEYEMTKDPKSGEVPRENLLAISKKIKKRSNGILKSGTSWEERGPSNVAGRTRALIFDLSDETGNTVFAGGVSGGIWRCKNIKDSNPSWKHLSSDFDNLSITTLAQDPLDKKTIYAGTGEGFFGSFGIRGLGIWKSTNGGNSWHHITNTATRTFRFIQKIVVDQSGYIYVGTYDDGVYKSRNGGASWTQVLGRGKFALSDRVSDIEIAKDGTLYVSVGLYEQDGIYRSEDDGSTWSKLSDGLPTEDYSRIELACAPNDKNYVYALYQHISSGKCLGIYKTINKGNTWTTANNPSSIGMSNFARNQAWYNLTAAVSPTNPDHIWIGGIDLLKSLDGGDSWRQVSRWSGNRYMPKVHADQHAITIHPNNSNYILFGNDGGVYISNDGNERSPMFYAKNNGFNVTQFYAVAIHPEAGKEYFLAGAQDNGTQQFTSHGVNVTTDVSGGDGGYVYIDEDEPTVQITSYIYNNYLVSIDNGKTFKYRNFGTTGRFINPSDYDHKANILYTTSYPKRYMRWTDVAEAGYDHEFVNVVGITGEISSISVSPSTSNRIYIGTDRGDLYYINDANIDASKQATKIRSGIGEYLSSIYVDPTKEKHILVTYSNYGVNSIYETYNGGVSWRSVEGNLPDMPVRSIIMHTNDKKKAMVATELGVWETAYLNGNATVWTQSNGIGNVRVDMLRKRKSDGLLAAATHGRGLFTCDTGAQVEEEITSVSLDSTSIQTIENPSFTDDNECPEYYTIIEIDLNISYAKPNAKLLVSKMDASTATFNLDYEILTPEIDLYRSSIIKIKIIDDGLIESEEKIYLKLSTQNAELQGNNTLEIHLLDNDVNIASIVTNSFDIQVGNSTAKYNDIPFKGFYHDSKSQLIFTAKELIDAGLKKGDINKLGINVTKKRTKVPYKSFTISLKHANTSQFTSSKQPFENDFTEVYSSNYTNSSDWNYFEFDQSFYWDGKSNLILQFCFDNSAWTVDDEVEITTTTYNSCIYTYGDRANGCTYSKAKRISNRRPNIKFISEGSRMEIASVISDFGTIIDKNDSAYFKNQNNEWIGIINNNSNKSMGCTALSVVSAGNKLISPEWLQRYEHSEKTYYLNALDAKEMTVSLFYTAEELEVFGDVEDISVIASNGYLVDEMDLDYSIIEPHDVAIQELGNGDYQFTFDVQDEGGYALAMLSADGDASDDEIILRNIEYNINLDDKFSIFPNPFDNELNISLEGKLIIKNWSISTIEGKIVKVVENQIESKISINTTDFEAGIYIIRIITTEGYVISKKLIKTK